MAGAATGLNFTQLGKRGFGFTGAHFHKNWQNDEFRQVGLNAVAWIAGLEVPAGGIPSETPTEEELHENMDYDRAAAKKPKRKKK